jgi:hypothetical protein
MKIKQYRLPHGGIVIQLQEPDYLRWAQRIETESGPVYTRGKAWIDEIDGEEVLKLGPADPAAMLLASVPDDIDGLEPWERTHRFEWYRP